MVRALFSFMSTPFLSSWSYSDACLLPSSAPVGDFSFLEPQPEAFESVAGEM